MKWKLRPGADTTLVAREGPYKFEIYVLHSKECRAVVATKNSHHIGGNFFYGPNVIDNVQKAKAWAKRTLVNHQRKTL